MAAVQSWGFNYAGLCGDAETWGIEYTYNMYEDAGTVCTHAGIMIHTVMHTVLHKLPSLYSYCQGLTLLWKEGMQLPL